MEYSLVTIDTKENTFKQAIEDIGLGLKFQIKINLEIQCFIFLYTHNNNNNNENENKNMNRKRNKNKKNARTEYITSGNTSKNKCTKNNVKVTIHIIVNGYRRISQNKGEAKSIPRQPTFLASKIYVFHKQQILRHSEKIGNFNPVLSALLSI